MGGGIIGRMGTVYHALRSKVDVVEMFDQVIPARIKTWCKFTWHIEKSLVCF